MARGRRSRARSTRNTCTRCRVFISNSATLCDNCIGASQRAGVMDTTSLPSDDHHPVICLLCKTENAFVDSLCTSCCPITLTTITSAECFKCRRIPLTDLNRINVGEMKRTKFGCNITETSSLNVVNLCDECTQYCVAGRQNSWSSVWPSAILDFLCGKYKGSICGKPFHKVLPSTIMHEYEHLLRNNNPNVETLFEDLTPKTKEYKDLRNDMRIENIKKAYNKYCFPEVKCPFGCSEFVGESGLIPMQYFLKMLDTNFNFGNTNWKKCFRCVRPDWLCKYVHNDIFEIKPHLVVDEIKGICVSTCRFHKGGSSKMFVHPPTNPTGRLPSKTSDRLGPATICYNSYKPAKANYSTHTYSMGVAKGNFSGISSTTISCKRKWDIAFGNDDVVRESLCSNKRKDIKPLLQKLVHTREISQDLFESITSDCSLPDCASIAKCLQSSTSVPFDASMAIKDMQEKGIEAKCFPFFSHPLDSYGCEPPDLAIADPEQLHIWCVAVMFSLSCTFHINLWNSNSPLDIHLKDLYNLMICYDGRAPDSTRKRNLVTCLQSLNNQVSDVLSTNIREFLDTISWCKNYIVTDRDSVETLLSDNDNTDIVSFTTQCRMSPNNTFLQDRLVTQSRLSTYELRSITMIDNNKLKTLVRHGKQYCCWWMFSSDSLTPSKIQMDENSLMCKFHSSWTCCHYERIDSVDIRERKYQYLEYLGGQGRFICEDHDVPLIVATSKQSTECSFDERCHRKAAWKCPEGSCTSAVCRKHFSQHAVNSDRIRLQAQPVTATNISSPTETYLGNDNRQSQQSDEDNLSDISDPESDYDEFSFVNFATDSGPIQNATDLSATNSGDVPQFLDDSNNSIPTHVLLNFDCHVLQRQNLRNERHKSSSRFLQNIVASSAGDSIPLIYPDSCLFPTQYYHEQQDKTMTGAIPAPLYNEKQSKMFNFADISDQKRTALLNPALLQSTDVRYIQTTFDTIFNKNLNCSDTRIVLNRGFQEITNKNSKSISSDKSRLQFDKADSRVRVNELAALLKSEPATFFLTLTCNQREHFGVAPIFDALETKYDRNNKDDWNKAVQAEIVLLTRAWHRSAMALMEYIEKSPDKPLGSVTKIWFRFEFQTTKGNLPHIHAVIWTKETKEELKYKVSCSGSSALFELKKIATETNLIDNDDVLNWLDQLMTVQTHSCEKANYRCHKVISENRTTHCRVPKYPQSHTYSWRKIPTFHSDEALEKLFYLDLAVRSQNRDDTYDVSSALQGGKFEYPASSDEHLSPFNTLLFVITKSSQNLQLCDEYLSARYIAKYAAGIEERADARIDPKTFKDITIKTNGIKNIKIAGTKSKFVTTDRKTLVQILALVETIWWILGFDYVYSSVKFIHLSTHEKSERAGKLKRKTTIASSIELPNYVRKISTFESTRHFTQSQLLLLKDYLSCEFVNCKISIFSGRPPALLFVDNPKLYFTWFKRSFVKSPETKVNSNVHLSTWIDVFGYAVHLRKIYLDEFEKFYDQAILNGNHNLHRFNNDTSILYLKNDVTGIKTAEDMPVQVVTSNIVPSNPYKFLVHFALSYGCFETEIDLFNQSNMIEVFKYCKLLPITTPYTSEHYYALVKKYVLDELKFLPGASRSFDRHFLSSFNVFYNLVMNNQVHYDAIPSVLHCELSENAEIDYLLFNNQKRARSVQGCLLNSALTPLRCKQNDFLEATREKPFNYNVLFPRADGQSNDSYEFQQHVFKRCLMRLDSFMRGNQGFVKHQLFLGRPGSGKTLVCTMLFLKAVARGLNCSITCLSGERAQQLGGEHVHKMFKFRVNKMQVPEHMASQSINALMKDVTRFTDLERLDVLFIDEIGQLNAELLCAMELVLQTVKENRLPMGGVFVIMSGDPKQLRPPNGSLVWLSPKLLSNYDFHYFLHYVRAVPGLLREILYELDENEINESKAAEIAKVIVTNCIIKDSWNNVNDDFSMRVFSTRAAEHEAVKQHTAKITNNTSCPSVTMNAVDEQSSTGSSIWLPTSVQNSNYIDTQSITPKKILFYKGVLLRFTANIPNIQARQGQLCISLDVPEQSATSLAVLIAPPGCRRAPTTDEGTLLNCGWQKHNVSKVYTPVINNGSCFLRRYFFPLKNYVASTIHKCLGDTFPKIVTKISVTESNYKIWEKEQLLVLLSRVSKLEDLTFVGSAEELQTTLTTIIQKQSCWNNFINNLLVKLALPPHNLTASMNLLSSNFLPWNIVLPADGTGFVYVLLSTKIANIFYIGESVCLRNSLREHNCGIGSKDTAPIERRPWALLTFATG